MKNSIKVKKAFTLIELIIVILLISTVSFLTVSNFKFQTKKETNLTLENMKEFLLNNFSYKKMLAIKCIEKEKIYCYLFIDDTLDTSVQINDLFLQKAKVYNYDKELSEYSMERVKIDEIEYEPFFELKIDQDKKHDNLVVEVDEKRVYFFSALSKEPQKFNNTNEIIDRFLELETEVRDAF